MKRYKLIKDIWVSIYHAEITALFRLQIGDVFFWRDNIYLPETPSCAHIALIIPKDTVENSPDYFELIIE